MKVVTRQFLFILCFFCSIAYAGTIPANNNFPVIRRASPVKVDRYLNDKDFVYRRGQMHPTNLWDRVKRWIFERLFSPIFKNQSITLWDSILYAFAAVAIILIIYYFIKNDKVGLFSRRQGDSINIALIDEDIHELDFDNLISGAIANSQFRIATRYLYLKSLKDLSIKGFIMWKAEKTNGDYINELRLSSFGKLFIEVTYLFDYAWYGNMDINEISFQQIKTVFDKFNLQIHSRR